MVLSRVLRSFIMSVIYALDEMGVRQPLGIATKVRVELKQ